MMIIKKKKNIKYIKDNKINFLIDTFGFFKNKSSNDIINDVFKFNLFDNYIFIDNNDNIIYKNKENINNIYSNELNFKFFRIINKTFKIN